MKLQQLIVDQADGINDEQQGLRGGGRGGMSREWGANEISLAGKKQSLTVICCRDIDSRRTRI